MEEEGEVREAREEERRVERRSSQRPKEGERGKWGEKVGQPGFSPYCPHDQCPAPVTQH